MLIPPLLLSLALFAALVLSAALARKLYPEFVTPAFLALLPAARWGEPARLAGLEAEAGLTPLAAAGFGDDVVVRTPKP